jgi:hypothetical protein
MDLLVGCVETEERHGTSLPPPARPVVPRWTEAAGGYRGRVIAFYSRRLGCLGSVVLSILLTACLIALFLLL